MRPKGSHAQIVKRIVVHTDDPVQPQFTLTMKGALRFDVVASPSAINLRDVKVGAKGTQTFELKLTEATTAKIVSVTLEDTKNFSLRRTAGEADGNSTYEIVFRGAKAVGVTTTKIQVITTGESTPELSIPVNASVALNLRYQSRLRFTRREGELQPRVLRISAREGDAPTIKKVTDPAGLLEIDVLESRGAMASISVEVDEAKYDALDEQARLAPYKLIVLTSDRDEPKLEIEYTIAPESSVGPVGAIGPATRGTTGRPAGAAPSTDAHAQ